MTSKINLFFGLLFFAVFVYFIFWGFNFIGNGSRTIFLLASIFGVFMAFNIGGNDVANSFGTSVGSKTLTISQALCIAAVFEVSGAVLAGSQVTNTIKKGIVNLENIFMQPNDFMFIMMSALIAAAVWLLIATKKGLPVSTTHSIVGAIVGSSLTFGFISEASKSPLLMVQWSKVGSIALSWVVSPLLGGIVSFSVYKVIKKYILDYNDVTQVKIDKLKKEKKDLKKQHKKYFESLSDTQKVICAEEMNRDAYTMKDPFFDPDDLDSDYYKKIYEIDLKKEALKTHKALEIGVPIVAASGTFVIGSMLFFKGLKNLNLSFTYLDKILILFMLSSAIWMVMFILAKTLRRTDLSKSTFMLFSWMQVFSACGFAFSHGSNDIANAVGPFVAIIDTLVNNEIVFASSVPSIVMFTFGVSLIVGLWFIGKEVITTVGTNLTKIHPASGLSAELAAAGVVMLASVFGLPVSSTHILIGAVLGIGVVNKETNWKLMKPIALAWIITLPISAIFSAVGFLVLRFIF